MPSCSLQSRKDRNKQAGKHLGLLHRSAVVETAIPWRKERRKQWLTMATIMWMKQLWRLDRSPRLQWAKEIFPSQETWTDRYGGEATLVSPGQHCQGQISPSSWLYMMLHFISFIRWKYYWLRESCSLEFGVLLRQKFMVFNYNIKCFTIKCQIIWLCVFVFEGNCGYKQA